MDIFVSPHLTGFIDKWIVTLDCKYVTDLSDYKKIGAVFKTDRHLFI